MPITTERVGRNLHIFVEGIDEPFVARPLPARGGIQITDTYLAVSVHREGPEDLLKALIMAVDGGHPDEASGRWEPVPEDEQTTYNRIGLELSQEESEDVLLAAFFWQTVLGDSGVRTFIDGGCGLAGTLRAASALTARLAQLPHRNRGGADV